MNQRACVVPLALAILFLGSTLWPVAAYGDRSDSSAGLQRKQLAAAVPALELRAPEPPLPKPASLGLQFAHAIIVRTSPEQGAVAPQTVGKVEVWYDAGIRSEFVALAVINAAGDRVDKHDAAIDTFDPSHVSTSVEALTPGEYTVRYRALSADGHQVSGAWVFEVNGQ
ncbi:MAG TPA: copper resistance CopC family protein [Methylocella sp.]|nr:copper resistance CopC family protein [Methylocella sp.]